MNPIINNDTYYYPSEEDEFIGKLIKGAGKAAGGLLGGITKPIFGGVGGLLSNPGLGHLMGSGGGAPVVSTPNVGNSGGDMFSNLLLMQQMESAKRANQQNADRVRRENQAAKTNQNLMLAGAVLVGIVILVVLYKKVIK